ncbi:hypothetical protein J4760_04150 [Salinicoccus sp. ID82-1]|uniref:hypothetical protein n=1 Tax=Salinicoccus sp. ID82-1 TaxID=2820269 RepID=UPI001F2A1060|nr:hypothetical protein [Salinicoccus sp. ID82-1]MCG1009244.1 hypothetical protein [Salinicoccus sp. ID82-1]
MKSKDLYDHNKQHVGRVEYLKRTSKAYVSFKPDNHYANVMLEYDEFEQYKKNFGFQFEEELNQLSIFDI